METKKKLVELWCDKYRPASFSYYSFHKEQAERLRKLVSAQNFPHLFLFGPMGSGKQTTIRALLQELFGDSSTKLKIESLDLQAPSGKKLSQRFISSNHHIEVNPSENGYYDRVVIQALIKDLASTSSLSKKHPFKVVVIREADCLTREAQQALRRTLEKYAHKCRVILVGTRASRIIPALRSRCLAIRNPAPTEDEIREVLKKVLKRERTEVPDSVVAEILKSSERNLRRALVMLQDYCHQREKGDKKGKVINFRYIEKIQALAKKLTEKQSPQMINEIRCALYDLQVHLIPPNVILRMLLTHLLPSCLDDQMKHDLIRTAAEADHRASLGSRSIIHLEFFAVKFMTLYRAAVEKIIFDIDQSMDFDD